MRPPLLRFRVSRGAHLILSAACIIPCPHKHLSQGLQPGTLDLVAGELGRGNRGIPRGVHATVTEMRPARINNCDAARYPQMHMRILGLFFVLLGMLLSFGCATHKVSAESKEQVFYYDRNRDGKVDLERHHWPGTADADWELRDDNFDGRYEKKVLYGIGIFESAVDLPVPVNVHIEPN